jgi:drug/metabolite transporter (DMT)-like permease
MSEKNVSPCGEFLAGSGSGGRILSSLALLGAMMLWGSSFVAMKYAFAHFSPMVVVFGRMAVATVCFLPFVPAFSRLPVTRAHVVPLAAMGVFEPCLYFLFEAAALQRTTASQASMITTMLPLMVAVASGLFLGERITRKTVAGFIIAASGALWLSMAGEVSEQAPSPLLGNLLEFLAMVSATGYIILMKSLSRTLPPLFLTAMQAFIGTLFFGPILLLPMVELPHQFALPAVLSVLYLGTFVTIGAYGLYNFGISRVQANQAAAYINLIPVMTLVFGFFLLGERLTGWQVSACLIVFGGVFLSQDSTAESQKRKEGYGT